MSKTKYEIINPSDKCYLSSKTLKEAAIAVFCLGEGQYALKYCETGEQAVPLFIFGGHDEWCIKNFSCTFEELLGNKETMRDVVEALESVYYESPRTSLNNIVGRAQTLAGVITSKLESGEL